MVLKRLVRETHLGRLAYKTYLLSRYYRDRALAQPLVALRFIVTSPEIDNFTYEISNYDEIEGALASALRLPLDTIAKYSAELRSDEDLRRRLAARLKLRKDRLPEPHFGRRIGWYIVARAIKPRVVVETGVHDGLGSAALLRALERNRAEGHPGELFGLDIDSTAAWLLDDQLKRDYHMVLGDSKQTVPEILRDREVDLFIHDSLHDYDHELGEYRLAEPHLSRHGVLLSDNAHAVPALRDYAQSKGRPYEFIPERSLNHFYPGGGLGISVANG